MLACRHDRLVNDGEPTYFAGVVCIIEPRYGLRRMPRRTEPKRGEETFRAL